RRRHTRLQGDWSSDVCSSDLSLRGRSLTTEIFPCSFREFLRFHQAEPEMPRRFGSATRAVLQHQIGAYLTTGGFPEVQELDAERSEERRVGKEWRGWRSPYQ